MMQLSKTPAPPPEETVDDLLPNVTDIKQNLEDISYFSESSNIQGVKSDLTLLKKKSKFKSKIQNVLESIKLVNKDDVNELKTVFHFVMQSAEDYFNHPKDQVKANSVKNELCEELLRPLVGDDVQLCRKVMAMVVDKIKPSTFLRRNKRLIKKIFLRVFRKLQQLL
jgi:uncharacterized protein YaaN involved in tellurite resistance